MKDTCNSCFKNLSVKSRFLIYNYINKKGTANVSDVTSYINLKQPTVSYHLKSMNKSGLLMKNIHGREAFYTISHHCPHDTVPCVLVHIENPKDVSN